MKAVMTVADPRSIAITLTMTATVAEWHRISEQLADGGPTHYGAAAPMVAAIQEMRRTMDATFDVAPPQEAPEI